MLVTFMFSFLWLSASIGLTIGFVLVIDAVLYLWRKPWTTN